MRKLILLTALLLSHTAFSQEVINLSKEMKCSNAEFVMNHFAENYGEVPIWAGKTDFNTHVTLMVNKEKRTWTLVEYDARIACVLGAGQSSSSPDIGTPTRF
jgi:hypothetical protein